MTATSLKSDDPAKAAKRGEAVSATHTPMTLTIYFAFAAIYVLWGSTYLAMRIGIETIPPLLLVGTRHLVTGLVLYPFLRARTGIRPSAAHWGTAAVTGILLLFSLLQAWEDAQFAAAGRRYAKSRRRRRTLGGRTLGG